MMKIRLFFLVCGLGLLGACSKEPPSSVEEFIANPILLEATVVRCSQNRSETRYDSECVNAREAVSRIASREEQAEREALEAQSERKRLELRRNQEAAAEALRLKDEAQRRREEAEYLGQFGEVPPADDGDPDALDVATNAPGFVIPDAASGAVISSGPGDSLPATDGGNAPVVEIGAERDLEDAADELRRRNEEPGIEEHGNEESSVDEPGNEEPGDE